MQWEHVRLQLQICKSKRLDGEDNNQENSHYCALLTLHHKGIKLGTPNSKYSSPWLACCCQGMLYQIIFICRLEIEIFIVGGRE